MKHTVLQGWLYGGMFGALFLAGCAEPSKQCCSCSHCCCQNSVTQARIASTAGTPVADKTKAATAATEAKKADSWVWGSERLGAKLTDKSATQPKADPPALTPKIVNTPLTVKPADSVAVTRTLPKPLPAPLAPTKVVEAKTEKAADPTMLPAVTPDKVPASIVMSKADGVAAPEVSKATYNDADGTKAHGHAPDYTWLVGELQFSYVRKAWRLRYAPFDEEERYGGSVTFVDTGALPMTSYQSGQLIRVEGRLRDPEAREPSPAFIVKSIQVLR
jgi:hypothetical protein